MVPEGSYTIRVFELSSSFVAHRDEKLRGGHNCALPHTLPYLVVDVMLIDFARDKSRYASSWPHEAHTRLSRRLHQWYGAETNF